MTKLNKLIFSVLMILIIIFLFIFELDNITDKHYQRKFNYFNTDIIINIKTNRFKKNIIFKNIEDMLREYDNLVSTTEEFDGIINLYKICHNFEKTETLQLNNKLYNLIEYGIELYNKTDGMIDISKGNVIDLWDSYLTLNFGIPTNYEIALANNQSIDNIILLNNNEIKNNKVNINLDYIVKGYVIDEIKRYLSIEKIEAYYINMDDLIAVGSDKTYKIGLENPDDKNSILNVIKESNKVVAHTSYSDKYYEYNGIRYNNVINSKTLMPANYHKSVWVISDDANKANYLSKILFMMSIDEGIEYIKNKSDIKVIWLTMDDKIIES